MLVSFKTEINPTYEQKQKINRTIGTCRYIYNFYLAMQQERYKHGDKLQSITDFDKWLNNEYLPVHSELSWIKDVSSKAIKQSMTHAYNAYRNFFKGKSHFPRFKKKRKSDVKMYFVRTDANTVIQCERHRIKIPTLSWVKLKEKGYIPTTKDGFIIRSGHVSYKAGRYYVSVLIDIPKPVSSINPSIDGLGIDLGLKEFATLSSGITKPNINKTQQVRKLEKRLKREQRCLSRKYESLKRRSKKKGEATRQNIQKQVIKVQRIYQRLDNIRNDHINQTINEIVKTKPSYVVIEDLNVSGMMKNRHLAKSVSAQKFYEFRIKCKFKCDWNDIELRIADRWYPSSKLCHNCGHVKKDLKLSDRTYQCECGYTNDRDLNAALNLRDATVYVIA